MVKPRNAHKLSVGTFEITIELGEKDAVEDYN
jgi:hypothetical protein